MIGGGPAGLAAAYTLRRRGVEATILEAADHAGGRMAGETVDGFSISTGAQFFDGTYSLARHLADELNVPLHTTRLAGGAMSQHVKGGRFRRVTFANLLLMRLYSPRALWQTLKVMLKLRRRRKDLLAADYAGLLDMDVPGESFAAYALRHGGPEMAAEVCDPLAVSVALAGPDRIGTLFGTRVRRFVMKWVRHLCQLAPVNTVAIASLSPRCASEITNSIPSKPLADRDHRNDSQNAPSSLVPTSMPTISRLPSAFTAVATATLTLTILPSSRTF